MNDTFSFVMPAELTKGEDGNWKVRGLASTEGVDRQGEILIQKGLDLSPVTAGKGVLNWEHGSQPEDIIGTLDNYQHTAQGLFVEGRLFSQHTKAQAVQQIMASLGKSDKGRVGMSVQGSVLERDPKNRKIIKKAQINAVAITMSPVNTSTFADLVKSMSAASIAFEADGTTIGDASNEAKVFTATEVVTLIQKALGASAAPAEKPAAQLTGGDAQAKEELAAEPKKTTPEGLEVLEKPKKLKKGDANLFKSALNEIMEKIKVLYPNVPEQVLWKACKDRLTKKFPSVTI